MEYTPVGHVTSNLVAPVDLTNRTPWLYVILALRHRLMYVGETLLLVERLSDHFGPYISERSTFRRAAARVGQGTMRPPFVAIAARLPADDHPRASFDGSSRKVRQLCEGLVHSNLARHPGRWWIVSTPQSPNLSATADMESACESIAGNCVTAIDFLQGLTVASPFNLVILGSQQGRGNVVVEEETVGALLSQIEVRLHQWLIGRLQEEYGERWWTEGVPRGIRVQCASRREEEGVGNVPSEAYLTFVDFRDIICKNWTLFGSAVERIAGTNGKDRATHWLVELNDTRKLWAHPIKQLFLPISQLQRSRVRRLWEQLNEVSG